MELNVAFGLADTLRQAEAEKCKVSLRLRGGQNVDGIVGAVGDHFVVLTRLTGREFFDALVRLDDISALEVQVRKK